MSSRRSIRWWLAMLAIAAALPLLVVVAWLFVTQLRYELREARDRAMRMARGAAAEIQLLHADSTALLQRMAEHPAVRNADGEQCAAVFAIVDFFPQYADLVLFDPNGRLICGANPQADARRIADAAREWVQRQIAAAALRPGQPRIRLIGDEWVSALAAPVTRPDGTPAGTLVLIQLPDVAEPQTLPQGSVMTIIDSAGTILARSADAERWTGRTGRGTEVTEIVLREREGRTQARGLDGVSRQYGFTHLPETGWFLYVGVPTEAVMQPVRELFLKGLAGGAAIVALAFIAALALSRFVGRPINTLVAAAEKVSREGYSTRVPVDGPREIAALGEAFNEMVESRSRAEAQIIENEQRLKALSDRLLTIQEEERTRIAREIHDHLGQSLTALKMDVGGLVRLTDSASPAVAPVRDRILSTLNATVEAVQRISAELRPSVLDDLGLVAAIEAEARLFEERSGIECDVSVSPEGLQLDHATESAIYRIVQESLTNVARHSDATRVEIRIRAHSDNVLLEVRDDGRGIRAEEIEKRTSLGLLGIRERAALVGGSVHFEGIEGHGTIVSVRIPVRLTA